MPANHASTASDWPEYHTLASGKINWQHFRVLLTTRSHYIRLAELIIFVAIYFGLTRLPLPWVDGDEVAPSLDNLWLLRVVDLLLVGGAFSHGSPLAVGIIPGWIVLMLKIFRSPDGIPRPIRHWADWRTVLLSVALSGFTLAIWDSAGALDLDPWWHGGLLFLVLMAGSVVALILDNRAMERFGRGLISLNIVLAIVTRLLWLVFDARAYAWAAVISVFFVVAIALVTLLLRDRRPIGLTNIQTQNTFAGTLYVPVSTLAQWLSYLILLVIVAMPSFWALSVFSGRRWSVGGSSGAEHAVIVILALLISVLAMRLPSLDFILSRHSPIGTAARLRNLSWVIPSVRAGKDTAQYLYRYSHRLHRRHYLLAAGLFVVMAALDWAAVTLDQPEPLILGPVATVFVICMAANLIVGIIHRITLFIPSVNYAEFWSRPIQIRAAHMPIETMKRDDIEALVLGALEAMLSAEEYRTFLHLYRRYPSIVGLVPALALTTLKSRGDGERLPLWMRLLAGGVIWVVLSLLALVGWLLVFRLITGEPLSPGDRIELLLVWLSTAAAIARVVGLDRDLRDLVRARRRRADASYQEISGQNLVSLVETLVNQISNDTMPDPDIVQARASRSADSRAAAPALSAGPVSLTPAAVPANPPADDANATPQPPAPPPIISRPWPFRTAAFVRVEAVPMGVDGGVRALRLVLGARGKRIEMAPSDISPDTILIAPDDMATYVPQVGLRVAAVMGGTPEEVGSLLEAGIGIILPCGAEIRRQHRLVFAKGAYLNIPPQQDPAPLPTDWQGVYLIPDRIGNSHVSMSRFSPFFPGDFSLAVVDRFWEHFNRLFIAIYTEEQAAAVEEVLGSDPTGAVRCEHALEAAERAIAEGDQDGHAHFNRGLCLTRLERYGEAVDAFETAYARNPLIPKQCAYWSEPFEAYFREGRFEPLVALANAVLRLHPTVHRAYRYIGRVHEAQGRPAEAQQHFDLAARYNLCNLLRPEPEDDAVAPSP